MPGPYPKTAAARAAAAKKYGLRPEDYEPYPDEEGYGDYPKLPEIGDDSKDFYNNYDMPDLRRNYGEPVGLLCSTDNTCFDVYDVLCTLHNLYY